MTTRPTQHPASNSDARKRAADLATPDWGSDLREPLDLDAIRARAEAATKGPWDFWCADDGRLEMYVPNGTMSTETVLNFVDYGDCPECARPADADAEFIAHARTDVPALVAEVERLRGEVIRAVAGKQEVMRQFHELQSESRILPCDAACIDAPEEDCSRHGREPADLWRIIAEVQAQRDEARAERDAAREALARVDAAADEIERTANECERLSHVRAGLSDEADLRTAALIDRKRAEQIRAALQPATDEGAGA